MTASTLAAAFSAALTQTRKPAALAAPARPVTLTVTARAIPMQKPQERKWTMDDDLLLEVLQQALTPADQIMARRTLLKPAPWELAQ